MRAMAEAALPNDLTNVRSGQAARLASKIGAAALTRDLYHTALDVIDRGSQPDSNTP
jgi:nitronate monooxygenase